MLGELSAIGAAISWALGSIFIKPLSGKYSPYSINSLRLFFGWLISSVIFIPLIPDKVFSVNPIPALYAAASGILSLGIGSVLYILSMGYLNLSRIYPISYGSWLLGTAILSFLIFRESLLPYTLPGAIFILAGINLLVSSEKEEKEISLKRGVFCSLLAGVFWAFGVIVLKFALEEVHPFVVNIIRLPFVVFLLFFLTLFKDGFVYKKYSLSDILRTVYSGFFDFFVACIFFYFAINLAGASRATILSSISPSFLLPFSFFIHNERLTLKIIIAILLSILGIILRSL